MGSEQCYTLHIYAVDITIHCTLGALNIIVLCMCSGYYCTQYSGNINVYSVNGENINVYSEHFCTLCMNYRKYYCALYMQGKIRISVYVYIEHYCRPPTLVRKKFDFCVKVWIWVFQMQNASILTKVLNNSIQNCNDTSLIYMIMINSNYSCSSYVWISVACVLILGLFSALIWLFVNSWF